jgi:hypothetical protein
MDSLVHACAGIQEIDLQTNISNTIQPAAGGADSPEESENEPNL